jgi:hypothetical protein
MKKSGKYIAIGFLAGMAISSMVNTKKFQQQIKDNVSMVQYRNRLIEFFGSDQIDDVFREMNHYIGFGLSPSIAFEMITMGDDD